MFVLIRVFKLDYILLINSPMMSEDLYDFCQNSAES